jgi:hypothetical protein
MRFEIRRYPWAVCGLRRDLEVAPQVFRREESPMRVFLRARGQPFEPLPSSRRPLRPKKKNRGYV